MIDFSISVPYERDIFTKILRPTLASHAPRVNIIKAKMRMLFIPEIYKNDGIKRTRVNIMPSKHNRAISKWVRCKINANKVKV